MVSFSVLMSVYHRDNAAHFRIALQSLLAQTHLPTQIVLVIDGSIGRELLHVVDWLNVATEDIGIKLDILPLSENRGLGIALQEGQRICTESYIARMDSDDISRSNRFELAAKFLTANPAVDILGGQIQEFTSDKETWTGIRPVPLAHENIVARARLFNPMNHVSVFIRKATLVRVDGYQDCPYFEDYYLWIRLLKIGAIFSNLPDVTVDVRVTSLGERRSGLAYIRHEYNFARKCYKIRAFSIFTAASFVLIRSPARILPPSAIEIVYRFIRKSA